MDEHMGTAESWRRLIEELARQRAGKFVVVVDGRRPVSVSRISQPYKLEERKDAREETGG
jgi:hypothetical protein